jgi:two-component system alkaline phosphatase synthesis response regulator PhoP
MMEAPLILLVDDEPGILQLGRLYLERAGFRVAQAEDGETALREAETQRPSLIILDVMLPKVDGFEICRRLRDAENDVAILILTARDDDIDKIIGLELGADDYLTKPFNPRELVARAKAILRRRPGSAGGDEALIKVGDLSMDLAKREVVTGGRSADLRAQEFDLLAVLARQPGRVFKREQLLQQAWGIDFYGQTRTVDVHVAQLRKKLSGGTVRIETVTGVGYRLVAGPDGR